MSLLKPGTKAPDFSLPTTPDQKVTLSDFRGRPVVLVFYLADWSPICGDQLALYNELLPEFAEFDAQVLGISVDQTWSHLAYAKELRLRFPLLADAHPHRVCSDYGAFGERALYVIDPSGVVHWSYLAPVGINPGADGVFRALETASKEKAHAPH